MEVGFEEHLGSSMMVSIYQRQRVVTTISTVHCKTGRGFPLFYTPYTADFLPSLQVTVDYTVWPYVTTVCRFEQSDVVIPAAISKVLVGVTTSNH